MPTRNQYTVALVCALHHEKAAVIAALDEIHPDLPQDRRDKNNYTLGKMGKHNVVVVGLPSGIYGTNSAAVLVAQMFQHFESIQYCLVVGVAGAAPSSTDDIRLGDVVVSTPTSKSGGVIQYDAGKTVEEGRLVQTGVMNNPPTELLTAVSTVRAYHMSGRNRTSEYLSEILKKHPHFQSPGPKDDILFQAEYDHISAEQDCQKCDKGRLVVRIPREKTEPIIHYGVIGSANQVMKHAPTRDRLAQDHSILCFEMESAGLMNSFPCLAIRGMCDYSDSHKNKQWQLYAAASAAAYAKEILLVMPKSGKSQKSAHDLLLTSEVMDALLLTRAEDDRNGLISMKGERVEGTCVWFIQHRHYIDWRASPQSSLLWVSGGPGKGKTMLAIYLTQVLEVSAAPDDEILLYYFCDGKDERRNTATAVLRGLLYQLLERLPGLLGLTQSDFNGPRRTEYTLGSAVRLWELFISVLQRSAVKSVTCILDGLDECKEESIKTLLGLISDHLRGAQVRGGGPSFKLAVFSRDVPQCIEALLYQFPRIRLDLDSDHEVSKDIERYVSSKIDILSKGALGDETLERVRMALEAGAHGTFLWVGFMIEQLKGKSEEDIDWELSHIPNDLGGIYARMLSQIKDDQKEDAALILHWIVLAFRPLTLCELATTIGIRDPSALKSPHELKCRVKSCGHLVRVDQNSVHLVHQSAKEYLQTEPRQMEGLAQFYARKQIHTTLASFCMDYLEENIIPSMKSKMPGQKYPFLDYSSLYWPEHLRLGTSTEETEFSLAHGLLQKSSAVHNCWWKTYWNSTRYGPTPLSFTLLHLAGYFGITLLARKLLLKKRRLVNIRPDTLAKDSTGKTPLHWAAARGHPAVARLLLKHRAKINSTDKYRATPLHLAVRGGSVEMVKLLLDNGANPHLKDSTEDCPLNIAIINRSKDIIEVFIEHESSLTSFLNKRQSLMGNRPHTFLEPGGLADELIACRGRLLAGRLERKLQQVLPLAHVCLVVVRLKLFNRIIEKIAFRGLRDYEANDGEFFNNLLDQGDIPDLVDPTFHILQTYCIELNYVDKFDPLFIVMLNALAQTVSKNKSLVPMGAKVFALGLQHILPMGFRPLGEVLANWLARIFANSGPHLSGFIREWFEALMTQWTQLLIEDKVPSATAFMHACIVVLIVVSSEPENPMVVMVMDYLQKFFPRLLSGSLRQRTIDCLKKAWSDELMHLLKTQDGAKIKATAMSFCQLINLKGDEVSDFTDVWYRTGAEILFEALQTADAEWIFTQEAQFPPQLLLSHWIQHPDRWQLHVLEEFLALAEESQSPMPPHLSSFVSTLPSMAELKQAGLRSSGSGPNIQPGMAGYHVRPEC